jgi:hypothetical protein
MRTGLDLSLVCCLLVLSFVTTATELRAQQRSPIPDPKALEQGQKSAREIYGNRFAEAKTATDKLALAKEMLDTASKVPDDKPANFQCTFRNHDLPANRYQDYGFRVVRTIAP